MHSGAFSFLAATVLILAAPAFADDLSFSLTSNTASGSPAGIAPDADLCLPPNCALFSGTLFDSDTDGSFLVLINLPLSVSFSNNPANGSLTLDNTFYDDVPLVLSGDPAWATDGFGNPPNTYTGPIFGIDIAPGTSVGVYSGTITISAAGGTGDPNFNGFTVSQNFTVDVTPEPAATGLVLAGLGLLAWRGIRNKCSSEA